MIASISIPARAAGRISSDSFAGFGPLLRKELGEWAHGKRIWIILASTTAFMALVAAVNFRGVGESVKANVVLTLVELSGLLLVIMVGLFAIFGGDADFSRVVAFQTPEDKGLFLAVTTATPVVKWPMTAR